MALAVVLLLLLGLSLVAVAGLSGAVADLALAALGEQSTLALEAAEAAAVRTQRTGVAIPAGTPAWPGEFPGLTLQSEILPDPATADIAQGGVALLTTRYFTVRAEGRAGRGAIARIERGYRVVGAAMPAEGLPCTGADCPVAPAPATTGEVWSDPVETSWRQLDATAE